MSSLSTLLAERVESLLPHTSAAACVPHSQYCSQACDRDVDQCFWIHRACHLSCHGQGICGSWYAGPC
jgi:hypothetical protein